MHWFCGEISRNCGICFCGCSSAIDQSRASGVHTQGIDSEGDEYEDDQEILDDSENSDDSDPELASPRLIRQTNLGMSQQDFVSQCLLVTIIRM